jgi:predicted dienelactone hydrolase
MRLLEILIIGTAFLALVTRLLPRFRKKAIAGYSPLVAGILIPIHLFVDGYRWQMVPIFVFILGLMVVSLIQAWLRPKSDYLIKNRITRGICVVFSSLLLILSATLPLLLPVVDLPEPGGPYAVGTTSFRMVDTDRKEVYTEDPDDYRTLLITVWYPAEIDDGMSANSYWDRGGVMGRAYSMSADMGTFWYNHLSLVKTNSTGDAPISSAEEFYPVVIYSHSFYDLNTENTILFEELASNGYVVFSMSHTFETIGSLYPDGEFVPGDYAHISELFDAHADAEDQLYVEYRQTDDLETRKRLINQILVVDEVSNSLMDTRTRDVLFALDQIEDLNDDDGVFDSRLNLDQIGIVGYSYGGATAIEACLVDGRFKAGINIDGWPYGGHFASGETISQPFMLIQSEVEDEMDGIVGGMVVERVEGPAYHLIIDGAWHSNFWDFPLFFRAYRYLGYWGPIDPVRLSEITGAYIVGFFDKHLKGQDVDLLVRPSELYPEVTFNVRDS